MLSPFPSLPCIYFVIETGPLRLRFTAISFLDRAFTRNQESCDPHSMNKYARCEPHPAPRWRRATSAMPTITVKFPRTQFGPLRIPRP